MRLVVSVLGAEFLALSWDRSPAAPPAPVCEPGLTEDGAPKRHETHTAATTQLGFRGRETGWTSP